MYNVSFHMYYLTTRHALQLVMLQYCMPEKDFMNIIRSQMEYVINTRIHCCIQSQLAVCKPACFTYKSSVQQKLHHMD